MGRLCVASKCGLNKRHTVLCRSGLLDLKAFWGGRTKQPHYVQCWNSLILYCADKLKPEGDTMLVKNIQYGLLVLFIVSVLSACAMGDPKLAWEKMSSDANIVLLDVRSQEEYDQGHLDGAMLIPVGELKDRIGELGDNKQAPIIVYCKRGIRSERAKNILEENGFANVVNGGGYEALLATIK